MIATDEVTKIRKTPTQKQLETLSELDTEDLLSRAVEAMHALNRRAKTKRDQAQEYRRASFSRAIQHELDSIYELKDRFLEACLRAGKATLTTFDLEREPNMHTETWYVVAVGGHRFHQPSVAVDLVAMATPEEPHDPTQPAREIPKVGLTIQAQRQCVELAIAKLK